MNGNGTTVIPFPLTPGEMWDRTRAIIWQVENPRCAFWRGALALGLRHKFNGPSLFVQTTQEELALLIIWSWSN